VIQKLPPDWKGRLERPGHTWFRAVEADLGQLNICLASAWRKTAIREDYEHNNAPVDYAPADYAMKEQRSSLGFFYSVSH